MHKKEFASVVVLLIFSIFFIILFFGFSSQQSCGWKSFTNEVISGYDIATFYEGNWTIFHINLTNDDPCLFIGLKERGGAIVVISSNLSTAATKEYYKNQTCEYYIPCEMR